jgi:uncharacterized repeat protein (TIGR02543 family)
MKVLIRLSGIFSLSLAITFSLATCDLTTPPDTGGTPPTFTVTFNANGGSGTVPGSQTVNAGSSVSIPSGSGLTKNGFTFGGWNSKADGTEINFSAGSSLTPTGNITLYAKWNNDTTPSPTTHTVTFNANGGDGTAPGPQSVNNGSSIALPSQGSLAKSGFTFGGWNTQADATGINFTAGASITPSGNITLYAQWNAPLPINAAEIVVTAPITGTTIDTTAYGSGNFTIGRVSWSPASTNLFIVGTVYTATVTLTANSGYTFTGLATATINGKNAVVSNNIGTVVTLSYTFPATESSSANAVNKYQAKSYTGNDRIKYSFSYGAYDFYYIYLGELANIPVFSFDSISHNGLPGRTYSIEMTEQIRQSSSRTATEHKQITTGTIDDITKSQTTGVKISVEASAKVTILKAIEVGTKVGGEATWSAYSSDSHTTTFQKTTSLTDTVQYVTDITSTVKITDSIDLSYYKAGYYRYSMFSVSDAYLYVIKDSRTNEIYFEFKEHIVPNTFTWSLDYSETPSFRKSDATSFTLDISILNNLPKPALNFGLPVTNTAQWNDALAVISNGGNGTASTPKKYDLFVNGNVSVPGSINDGFGTAQYIEVTLKGDGKLSLNSNGCILALGNNQKLIIDDQFLTLQGRNGNDKPLFSVGGGGTLELKNGAITGNTTGSGVYVLGTFTMNSGTISGNSATSGGGVFVDTYGSFIMNGGAISGNTSASSGGGVYVNGTFTMNGGTISGNTATTYGGGVYVNGPANGGTFNKTGGSITGYDSDAVNGNVAGKRYDIDPSFSGHAVYAGVSGSSGRKIKNTTAGPGVNLSFDGKGSTATSSGSWDR